MTGMSQTDELVLAGMCIFLIGFLMLVCSSGSRSLTGKVCTRVAIGLMVAPMLKLLVWFVLS